MRRDGREVWTRIASLVLVALVAALALPLGASLTPFRLDAPPAARASVRRIQTEARPVASTRRTTPTRDVALVATTLVVATFALLGLLRLVDPRRLAWMPAPLAVQRGPPSLR